MRALLVLLTACSYERSELPPPPPPPRPVPAPVVLRPPPIVVVGADAERHLHPGGAPRAFAGVRPATDGISAAHSAFIAAIAVTDDGTAAVTADLAGGTRLWPALDGSLEPVVVAADHPAQLAIARDGDGFVIATLDRAGQLTFLTVGGSGAIGWQAIAESPRPFIQVVAAAEDFAAITDDGHLATFALGGVPRATFAPPPGERLAQLAVRGGKRLALVSTADGVRARWFGELGFEGEPTVPLAIDPAHAVLSPSGTHLAATRRGQMGIAVVDLASGKARVAWRAESLAEGSFPIGFSSERALWYLLEGEVALERDGTSELQKDLVLRNSEPLAAAIGARGLVWGRRGGLLLTDGVKPRVLGYRIATAVELVPLDHGFAVSDGSRLSILDERFAERERIALPPGTWAVAAIDRHRVLANVRDEQHEAVVAVDLDDRRNDKVVIDHPKSQVYYQPASHLFAATVTDGVRVGRYDPATDTFSETMLLNRARNIYQLELPPSGGVVIEGEGSSGVEIVSYAIDKAMTLIDSKTRDLRPDETTRNWGAPPPTTARHGALIATGDGARIHLRDGAHERWVVPSRGITGLYFTPRGELIGQGGGLVHLDLATGALVAPRCGWQFGAWDEIDGEFDGFSTSLCDLRE